MKTYDTEYEIYFEDISPSGKVHLEKVAEWMSMGRERFFRDTCPGHLDFVDSGVFMFTVQMTINMKEPSVWADKIKCRLSFTKIKKISFEIHFDFLNLRTNQIMAKGMQKVAFVEEDGESFAPVPVEIDKSIRMYKKE